MLAGPGADEVRGPRRINAVLTAVRGFLAFAVDQGEAPQGVMRQLYELADSRSLPAEARGEDGAWRLRMRARHHVQVPKTRVSRASDEEVVALLRACRSARDRQRRNRVSSTTTVIGAPSGSSRSTISRASTSPIGSTSQAWWEKNRHAEWNDTAAVRPAPASIPTTVRRVVRAASPVASSANTANVDPRRNAGRKHLQQRTPRCG